MVYFRPDGFVAYIRVDVVSEVQYRSPLGHLAGIALRRKDHDLVRVERKTDIVQKFYGIFRGTLQCVADLFKPFVEFVFAAVGLFVLPVGRESAFGNLLHAFGTYLHFGPNTVRSHHRGVKRFVAVGFREVHPVADAVRFRSVDIRYQRVDMPALRFLGDQLHGFENDADGEQVVYVFERDALALHLRPNGEDAFDPSRNGELDAVLGEPLPDRGNEAVDEFASVRIGFVQLADDFEVLFRIAITEAEVFQFRLYGIQPQPVSERCEQIEGFARNLHLLVARHGGHGPHVVQPVRNLDEDYPYVVRKGKQYLAEVSGLLGGVGIHHSGHLGQAVYHVGDLLPEDGFDLFHRVGGILHHVVKQSCGYRLDT